MDCDDTRPAITTTTYREYVAKPDVALQQPRDGSHRRGEHRLGALRLGALRFVACLIGLTALQPSPGIAADHARTLLRFDAAWSALVWPTGSTIRACFFLGDRPLRQAVVRAAGDWQESGNIRFDFGAAPGYRDCDATGASALRVAFQPSAASRSRIGTRARDAAPNRPTLYIGTTYPDGIAQRSAAEIGETALHELGHFLGLPHEHQHPDSPCPAELITPARCSERSNDGRPGLATTSPDADAFAGAMTLRADSARPSMPYDPASIMHYRFPAHLLRNGISSRCGTTGARVLSDGDRRKMAALYPRDVATQRDFLLAEGRRLGHALEASGLPIDQIADLALQAERDFARSFPDFAVVVPVDPERLAPSASLRPATAMLEAQCELNR